MSELNILFPKPVVVRVESREVTIRPVCLRDFEAFGKAAGELISLMAKAGPAEVYGYARQTGALSAVLGSTTNLSSWRIKRLPIGTAVELMFHVIKVNSGFFDQALVSAAQVLAGAQLYSR
ncbi:MAG: hypothetical protein OZ926_14795 [Pseudomonas sp.]|nr:hypothetical protein [Pseudomonas sp.]